MDPTILENSVTGFSRSKTVARACASTSCRLQERLGWVIRSSHPVITWLVQHAADCISKYWVSEDGKSAHERLKEKPFSRYTVEFDEKVLYKRSNKGQKEHKIESKWSEGYFAGFYWRASEAIVGTNEGVTRAGTSRRVGAHRRWDAEVLDAVRGVPWKWDPVAEEAHDNWCV